MRIVRDPRPGRLPPRELDRSSPQGKFPFPNILHLRLSENAARTDARTVWLLMQTLLLRLQAVLAVAAASAIASVPLTFAVIMPVNNRLKAIKDAKTKGTGAEGKRLRTTILSPFSTTQLTM